MGSLIFTMRESKENGDIFIWHKRTLRMIRGIRYSGHECARKLRDSPFLLYANKRRWPSGITAALIGVFPNDYASFSLGIPNTNRTCFRLMMEKTRRSGQTTREQVRFFANAITRKRGSLHYKRRAHKSVEYLPVLVPMPWWKFHRGSSNYKDSSARKRDTRETRLASKMTVRASWKCARCYVCKIRHTREGDCANRTRVTARVRGIVEQLAYTKISSRMKIYLLNDAFFYLFN